MSLRTALESWLFRLSGPEPGPIVLPQRRVFILPSKAGLAFAASLLLMLLASINYSLSLGFLVTFLLAGLGIVAILRAFRNLLGLSIRPGKADPVFAGQEALFSVLLENERDEPRYAIEANLPGGPDIWNDLPPRQTVQTILGKPATQRGWLPLGRVTVATGYPLGLARAWSHVEPELRCLVFPRPEENPPPLPWATGGAGQGSQSGEGSEDFLGLRPYHPPDSPRRIAWKSLAPDGGMLTKQFAGSDGRVLWLDWRALPETLDTEARLSRLTAWLVQARAGGMACGLSLPGFDAPPLADDSHFQRCLEALALWGLDTSGAPS